MQTFADIFGTAPARRRRGARAREPHRRTHRLQRRVRAADRDSPADPRGAAAAAGRQRARVERQRRRGAPPGSSSRSGARPPTRTWLDYVQGVTVALRQRGLPAARRRHAHRVDGADRQRPVVERRARGERRARACARPSTCASTTSNWRWRGSGPRTSSSARRPASWTRWWSAWAPPGAALFLDTRSLALRPRAAAAERRARRHRLRRQAPPRDRRVRHAAQPVRGGVPAARRRTSCATWPWRTSPRVEALDEPFRRRARHVVTEDERVLQAVAALRANDPAQVGELFYASHASMRDDYEVSVPQVDALVEIASSEHDVLRRPADRRRLRRVGRHPGEARQRPRRRRPRRRALPHRVRRDPDHPPPGVAAGPPSRQTGPGRPVVLPLRPR